MGIIGFAEVFAEKQRTQTLSALLRLTRRFTRKSNDSMNLESLIPNDAHQMLATYGRMLCYDDCSGGTVADLSRTEVTDRELSVLVCFPGFDSLNLWDTAITDAAAPWIGQMTFLRHLCLNATAVSDKTVDQLSMLRQLDRLDLNNIRRCFENVANKRCSPKSEAMHISDNSLRAMQELPSLNILQLAGSLVTDRGLERHAENISQISALSLACTEIGNRSLTALHTLKWLEHLNIAFTEVTDEGVLDLLWRFVSSLQRLNLGGTAISHDLFTALPEHCAIQRLRLGNTNVSDKTIPFIASLKHLARLTLASTNVSDEGLRSLENSPWLEQLDVSELDVTDDALVWLSDLPLQSLRLRATNISDAGLSTIGDFAKLERLDISETSVTNRGLHFLAEAPQLNALKMASTQITEAGLSPLQNLPLQELTLSCDVGDQGAGIIGELTALKRLSLYSVHADNLAPLSELQNLEYLSMKVEAQTDIASLSALPNLKKLDIQTDTAPSHIARLRNQLPQCIITERKVNFLPNEYSWDEDAI